jgi:3-hydroxybutyryl-CoA dehydratase
MPSIGDSVTLSKTITSGDISKFIEISGDANPIHHDAEFAKRTFFKRPIAHGLISASLISAGLTKLMGDGNLWLSQNLKFEKPVYVGDTVTAYLKIVEIDDHEKCKVETIVKNQKQKVVISGFAETMKMYLRKAKTNNS